MEQRAVLFDLWGVVVRPGPAAMFRRFEEDNKLPRGFVWRVATQGEGVLTRAERGELTLSQMIPELDSELVKHAKAEGLTLPSDWTVRDLLAEVVELRPDPDVLQTAVSLRRDGVLTAVLANQWVNDGVGVGGAAWARLLCDLHAHFDLVLQSCHAGLRVPEPAMLTRALQGLKVTAQQAFYLSEEEEGVQAAVGLGMKALLVENLTDSLVKLAEFTRPPVSRVHSAPLCCNPDQVAHGYVSIKPGVRTHYVQMGSGPPIILCHGFPESWYSWRYQIPALAAAGFSVYALDMKGYGESTAPDDIEEYSQEQLCKDLMTFMDVLAIPQVTLVGHDWGGALVWSMAQYHPERVRAVASLNTPLFPADPNVEPMKMLKAIPIFNYQIYFQEPGVAERELEKDLERTFKLIFMDFNDGLFIDTAGVCARGGLFVGLPEDVGRSRFVSEADLHFYIQRFRESGFRKPLNWYRNVERNWKWMCSRPRGKLLMPALMVTAEKDHVLLPSMCQGMDERIPNLTKRLIEGCGHWTQMEKPAEVNQVLVSWLQEVHGQMPVAMAPKL